MSTIQIFFINNYSSLVAMLLFLIALVKGLVTNKKQKTFTNIYGFISAADKLDKSGLEKFDYVFDLAYNKMPNFFKLFISENDVKMAIEYAFNKLKSFTETQAAKETSTQATNDIVATTKSDVSGEGQGTAVQAEQVASPVDAATEIPVLTDSEVVLLTGIIKKIQTIVSTASTL